MSMAYLEIGEIAGKHENQSCEYSNAIAYQLYHALELFFKYAISLKEGSVEKTHDLKVLFDKYDKIYTEDIYRLNHPFDFSSYEPCELNFREKEQYEEHIKKFKPKYMDQHLRYPPDKRTGGFSYNINSDFFHEYKNKLIELHGKMSC